MPRPPRLPAQTLLTSLALSCSVPPAHADEGVFFDTLPVVLSVSRLSQPVDEAPGAVTVLDREILRASGARSLTEVLRLVPGFQVAPGSQQAPLAIYHGLAESYPARLQVLVDGRSLYSPLFRGGINWNLLPVAVEDIERVEVLRGSNSAAYGSNAFLGVVNIVTVHGSQAHGGRVVAGGGDNGMRDLYLRGGGGQPGLDYRVTYREQHDNGLDGVVDDRLNRLLDARVDLALGDRDTLQLGFGQVRAGSQYGVADDPCRPPHDADHHATWAQLGWRRALGAGEDMQLNLSHTDERAADDYRADCDGLLVDVDAGGKASRDELEFQHSLAPRADLRLVWGAGLRAERVRSSYYFQDEASRRRQITRVFGNLEWRPAARWLVNAGASWEDDSRVGQRVSPRITLHHHLDDAHSLRLGVGTAYRAPSLFDTEGSVRYQAINAPVSLQRYQALPGLESERVNSREIGYLGQLRALPLSIDARLFEEHIPNRIQDGPALYDGDGCRPMACLRVDYSANAEDVRIRGFEYQLRWEPSLDARLLWSQTWVDIATRFRGRPFDDSAAQLAKILTQTEQSAPAQGMSLMWMQRLSEQWDWSLAWYKVGDLRWTRNTRVDGYDRLDLRVARTFRMGGRRVELAYVGRGLFGDAPELRDGQPQRTLHYLSLGFEL